MSEQEADQQAAGQPRQVLLTPDELLKEFQPIVREGLPVTWETAGEKLPYFRVVLAHARSTDHLARVLALDDVLTALVRDSPADATGDAIRTLFGLAPGSTATTLTRRQELCAGILGYDVDHFRKRIQRKLVQRVMMEFLRRDRLYKPRTMARVPVHELPPFQVPESKDEFAKLELEARICSEVYGVQANLFAYVRFADEAPTVADDAIAAGLWHYAGLLRNLKDYIELYGDLMVEASGRRRSTAEFLAGVGMQAPFTPDDAAALIAVRQEHEEEAAFRAAVPAAGVPAYVVEKWREWVEAGWEGAKVGLQTQNRSAR